jgi:predicted RNA binding protein YcfA (HicA-like mRNA interferase family)
MKVREVIRLLEKHGWVEMRSRGNHRHFKHPDEAFVITVPGSDGKELAPVVSESCVEENYRPQNGSRTVSPSFGSALIVCGPWGAYFFAVG